MEKINIAELLKDCPKGMELDCTMYENVTFEEVVSTIDCDGNEDVNIILLTHYNDGTDDAITLTNYGTYTYNETAKCVIFPKGKTTWEGFVPPYKFNAGDVLVSEAGNIVLLSHIDSKDVVHYHCIIPDYGSFRIEKNTSIGVGRYYDCVLANEEQRQRMYDKIKCSGYKYNQNTNKLEKLVKPKFKVGDRIKQIGSPRSYIIKTIEFDRYVLNNNQFVRFRDEHIYELVSNKFDIATLKPYDKVLYRMHDKDTWCNSFYSFYKSHHHFVTSLTIVRQCIPYEGNEHLLGTTDDCDDYYKIW